MAVSNKSSSLPEPLCAKHKESFAYETVKDRMPVILTKAIDTCYKHITTLLKSKGEQAAEDAKKVVGDLSKLRNELTTDKPFLALDDDLPDACKWNDCLEQHRMSLGVEPSAFSAPWLFSECVMYRRIAGTLCKSEFMKDFDPYQPQKDSALENALPGLCTMAHYLCNILDKSEEITEEDLKKYFQILLKASLWSNRFDLSLSAGENHDHQQHDPVETIKQLESYILIDDSIPVFDHLRDTRKRKGKVQVDFVIDNAGFEFCSDLLFAEYLLATKIVDTIRIHVKSMPWFVSDVTYNDFERTLAKLVGNDDGSLSRYGKKWQERLKYGSFVLVPLQLVEFWTLPRPYSEMKDHDPKLYDYLSNVDLILFKGDMNFRKLVGDLNWSPETPFETALQGFHPAPLCTLRTQKADVVVGLKPGQAEETQVKDSDWMVAGKYAVIQSHLDPKNLK